MVDSRLPTSELSLYDPAGDRWSYPGDLPNAPYLLVGDQTYRLRWREDHFELAGSSDPDLERALRRIEARNTSAQLAYGANRNPANLVWKLSAYATANRCSRDAIIVPAVVREADVVACNIGYWGYVYGSLLLHRPPHMLRPYLRDAVASCAVLWLDADQVHAMHRSEGVPHSASAPRAGLSCDVTLVEAIELESTRPVQCQTYALPLPYLSFDGESPAPLAAVDVTGGTRRHRFGQRELWERLDQQLGLCATYGFANVASLVDCLRGGVVVDPCGASSDANTSRELYQTIRQRIIDELPLRDTHGAVVRGTDGIVPASYDLVWS